MDLTNNYIKWISDFSTVQFDKIVYKYLEEVLKITDYSNTDGTNDGGNDIRIYANGEKVKSAFQLTIQENGLDKKIDSDLKKTKRNIDEYGYQKRLHFFYSHPISEEKANEYELLAETKYGIKLYLIDAKKIAFTAKKYVVLLKEIHAQYGLEYNGKTTLNEVDRMLYDFYSFGSSAAEIKGQIIKSFIVNKLHTKGIVKTTEIINDLFEHFKSKDISLFNRVINQLIQEGRLITKDKQICLSEIEQNRVDVLKEQFNFQEYQFKNDLRKIIEKFKINEIQIQNIIVNLRTLFESSFNADKQDVLDKIGDIEHDPISDSIIVFFNFVKSISNENKARYITKELIEACRKNDLIQKLSAGKIFTSFSDPEVIRNYLNQTERLVFLDTTVVLYSLCLYSNDIEHTNYYYNSIKDLFKLRNENKNLRFLFYRSYLSEVVFHFKEALLITDFDKAGLIESLGGSTNVFYNFYVHLKDKGNLDDNVNSFEEFLLDSFDLSPEDLFTSYFQGKVISQIKQCLNSLEVDIFENPVPKEIYNFSVEIFDESLEEKERKRGRETIQNDSYMLSTLFNDELSVNEPIFVTWDLVFLNARKKYHQKIPASRLWHWFTPERLINHLSLLNFKLNSETITREILTIIDDKFNLYKKTQSLLDTVSKLINIKTSTGKKYVNAIKEFKKDYIYEVSKKPQLEYKDIEEKKVYPVEEVMFSLVKYYLQNKEGYNLDDFKSIFQTEIVYSDVISYFKTELTYYMNQKRQSDDAISKMNGIIKKSKEFVEANTLKK